MAIDYIQYLINDNATIKDVLIALNEQKTNALTVFVLNQQKQVVGTVTDGDIRRALIKGANLNDNIANCMNANFTFIRDANFDVRYIKELNRKGRRMLPVLDVDGHLCDIKDMSVLKSIIPIDAVLMAGGKGERLRPLTEKTPKPLLKVGDKCIIDHNIDRLIRYGIKHINVTVNYLAEQIEEHYDEPLDGIKVHTVREPKFLGTIGSIKFVESFHNDVVLVMNSDLFTNIDYEDFYLHFEEHDADMSVAAVPYNVSIPYGILDLDGRNIKGLLEKPKYNYYANAGIYLIRKSALQEVPDDKFFNATDLIEKLISENKKVVRYPLNGTWIDIGTPQEYQKAQELVKHLKMF